MSLHTIDLREREPDPPTSADPTAELLDAINRLSAALDALVITAGLADLGGDAA